MSGAETIDRAPSGVSGDIDLLQRRSILLRRHDIRNPAIGETPGASERGIGPAAAPDRRPTRLSRRRLHRDLAKFAEILAAIADRLTAPQFAQQRDRRRQPAAALVQGY